jgi:hypothetical protein
MILPSSMLATIRVVIEELLPAVFDVFESDPVTYCQPDLLSLEHNEFPCLLEWKLLPGANPFRRCSLSYWPKGS